MVGVDRGDKEEANTALRVCPNSVNDDVSPQTEVRTVCGESLQGAWWVSLTGLPNIQAVASSRLTNISLELH